MFETFRNAWKTEDLRKRLLYTLLILILFRLGCAIPVPYITSSALESMFTTGSMLTYLNMMSGGAMSRCTIFALGVQPYINATIIIQLLCVAIPYLENLSKEGEEGRQKLTKISNYTGAAIALLLSIAYYFIIRRMGALKYTDGFAGIFSGIVIVACFTAGAQFVTWMGNQIDAKGIGNGVYTNKPRTTGEGYMGMIHQPDPEKKPDMLEGILAIRHMHMRVLQETGFSTADEMLYPENLRYLSDIMSYIAVGARSVENQFHRLVASGCDVPVGLKNPTSGDLTVMLNSVVAAQVPHDFIFRGWEVQCPGNPLSHTILRGAVNKHGQTIPNYHYEDLRLLYELYMKRNLKNPACIVDTNHSNSGKQYMEQIRIAKEVLHSRRHSDDIKNLVKGLMIESYIEPGSQKIGEHCYGKSITDPCLGWDDTERLLYDIAELS